VWNFIPLNVHNHLLTSEQIKKVKIGFSVERITRAVVAGCTSCETEITQLMDWLI